METKTAEFVAEVVTVSEIDHGVQIDTLARIVEIIRLGDRYSSTSDVVEAIEDSLTLAGLNILQYDVIDSERDEEDDDDDDDDGPALVGARMQR
jgi:Ran GTPase-activating protein (RanGAP) involved in mRNA processing and transport